MEDQFSSVQLLSQVRLFATPMDGSMPGLPVHHQLLEFAQTHVHQVGDAIQPSHPLSTPSPSDFNLSQNQCFFPVSQLFASGSQSIGASVSASALSMSIQGWVPLGLTGLISYCSRDSQESSPAPPFKSISSSALSRLHGLFTQFSSFAYREHDLLKFFSCFA